MRGHFWIGCEVFTPASVQKEVGKVLFWLLRLENALFLSAKPTFFFMDINFLHKHSENWIWKLKREGQMFVLLPPLSTVTLEVFKPC